ncbi:MAG TPA: DUF4157 domain-containing protein, partial [Coleofasciculaceae cyanobacterium]
MDGDRFIAIESSDRRAFYWVSSVSCVVTAPENLGHQIPLNAYYQRQEVDMGDESTHSFQKKNSSTSQQTNQFGSRPFATPVQMKPKEQQTPEELENEAFNQNKFEAFGLQLKENTGTITPVEQERLGVLQAKMDDFWAQRLEKASRSGFDFSKVSVTPSESAAPQLQPMGGQRSPFNSPQPLSVSPIQAKLTIGEPGDKYEQEADRIASQVVEQINAPASAQSTQGQSVQRQEEKPEEELQAKSEITALQRQEEPEEELQTKPEITALQRQEEPEEELQAKPSISDLQRSPLSPDVQREAMSEEDDLQAKPILQRREAVAVGEASTDLDTAINSARGGGQPLDAGLQRSMGQAMGADFSGVRVHTDAQSDQLNQSIQAKAFTTGQDVFFRRGEYQPGSRGGQELLAHELTHIVQQNGGENPWKQPLQRYKEAKQQVRRPSLSEKVGQVIQRTLWEWTAGNDAKDYWNAVSTKGEPTRQPTDSGKYYGQQVSTENQQDKIEVSYTYDDEHGKLHFGGNPNRNKTKWNITPGEANPIVEEKIKSYETKIVQESDPNVNTVWHLVFQHEKVVG